MKTVVAIMGASAIVMLLAAAPAHAQEARPLIQMAILLDNSGSMSGLINQAKAQLWNIVNEFATTRKAGRVPLIEVALYTYGNPPPRMILPLTGDLDAVSEKLFAVRISGGSEYCGQVIQEATRNLKWSDRAGDLKVIFIAGNEPFTQGSVDYRVACKEAISRGIIVNTIHCGDFNTGVSSKWQDGALLADGKYLCINQNQRVVHISAPQDSEIARLGAELNSTYVAYGTAGRAGKARQLDQDKNAGKMAREVLVERAVAKSSAQYRNASWDLVDALEAGSVKLDDIEKKDLPEKMQGMNEKERAKYVKAQAGKRSEIQSTINTLNVARKKHIAQKQKELAKSGKDTLGAVMIKAVREQAAKKNFKAEVKVENKAESKVDAK